MIYFRLPQCTTFMLIQVSTGCLFFIYSKGGRAILNVAKYKCLKVHHFPLSYHLVLLIFEKIRSIKYRIYCFNYKYFRKNKFFKFSNSDAKA